MSESERQPTHRLAEQIPPKPLVYYLGIAFYPNIMLESKAGMEFGAGLCDYLGLQKVECESNQWTISSAKDECKIIVKQNTLHLEAENPSHGQERFERQYATVLDRCKERFALETILESRALIRTLVTIDGDARHFLSRHVMNIRPNRLGPMGRPLHILGVRMFFPPYAMKKESGGQAKVTPWQVNVKLESWIRNTSMLFVEAEAAWPGPAPWDQIVTKVVGRLQELQKYLTDVVIPFLKHEPDESEDQ